MTVLLTISETLDGAPVGDGLAGGGSGIDLGSVINNQYAPLGIKASNTGHQNIFVSHDATVDPITDFKIYMDDFAIATGFTYGGAATSAGDYSTMKSLGLGSGSSKNNADGLSGGLWFDFDWDATTANQFDQANFPALVKIFGDNTTDGTTLATAFVVPVNAMVYNAPGETSASAPVAGKIGKAADTVLGDACHIKARIYLPNAFGSGGIVQWANVFVYSFTA